MSNTIYEFTPYIEDEIPLARKNLLANYEVFEKIAEFCDDNYHKTSNKKQALEQTKNHVIQSLANVSYQINNLACNMFNVLNLQTNQLSKMESSLHQISQKISVYKEKVARKRIGVLTTQRSIDYQHKILVPESSELPSKYIRSPIDYSILDDIGHGIKISSNYKPDSLNGIYSETGIYSSSSIINYSNSSFTLPKNINLDLNKKTLTKLSNEYSSSIPVVISSPISSNHSINYLQKKSRNIEYDKTYSTTLPSNVNQISNVYQISSKLKNLNLMKSNIQQNNIEKIQQTSKLNIYTPSSSPPPPPPQLLNTKTESCISNLLPPPPFNQQNINSIYNSLNIVNYQTSECISSSLSSPLPSPPSLLEEPIYNYETLPTNIDYIPDFYIEKVIALYDYTAVRSDELSFKENSVIYVIKKNEDNWYEGVLNGIIGFFPGNYVESCR